MTNGHQLKPHPLASRLPEMSLAEYQGHKASIQANGLRRKIILFEGKILDGRHRYRACRELQIEPKFETFRGDRQAAVQLVIDEASHRNMSDGQKCWAAAQFVDDLARSPGRRKNGLKSEPINGKSLQIASLRFGVSVGNVSYTRTLMQKAPALFARLGTDRTYNVNRAMQEWRRGHRQREHRKLIDASPADMKRCDLRLGDVVELLEAVPSKSVRVIFADPPYNIGKKYHGDPHGDQMEDVRFLAWCTQWVAECKRVLTDDGSIFVMINGLYAARLEMVLRDAGLHRRNTLYWWENNPENQTGNFSDAVRPIHYFTKTKGKFVFDDNVRVDSRRQQIADKRGLDDGKIPDNVWIDCRIPGNSKERVPFADAPPQLPIAVPERCILIASEPLDTVLDPFNGNGTSGIAALIHGRKYIGLDRSKKYLDQSRKWIASQLARRAKEDGRGQTKAP